MVGRATRLSRYITALDKSYKATAILGAYSDTLDAEGEISQHEGPVPHEREIRAALHAFTGPLDQIPPMASALKQGGRRLYELHRQGITVERQARRIEISSFELTDYDAHTGAVTFDISCSSGTYVRTLVADLASSLGSAAYLTALRRTSVGHLTLNDASTPDDLTAETLHKRIIPAERVVGHLPALETSAEEARAVRHGRAISHPGLDGSFRVVHEGALLGVYAGDGAWARAEVVLWG